MHKTRSGTLFGRSSIKPDFDILPSKDAPEDHTNEILDSDDHEKNVSYTLRSRPLDVNMKLNVKITDTEPEEEDGYLAYEDSSLKERRPSNLKVSGNVVTPSWTILPPENTVRTKWTRSSKYIANKNIDETIIKLPSIEYDMSSDDEDFMESLNEVYEDCTITETEFESFIDFFEKEYAYNNDDSILPVDSILMRTRLNICDICFKAVSSPTEGNSTASKKDSRCVDCNVLVHKKCCKSDTLPSIWTCLRCRENSSESCRLCGNSDGLLEKKDGQWYHTYCLNEMNSYNKTNALTSPHHVEENTCLCGKSVGYFETCSHTNCLKRFHPRCAMTYGLFINQTKSKKLIYCRRHSLKHAPSDPLYYTLLREPLNSEEMDSLKKVVFKSNIFTKLKDQVLMQIFLYWVTKRNILGRELIYRLYLLSKDSRQGEVLKQKLKKVEEQHSYAMQIRQYLERIRILVDLCKKREQTKKQYLETLLHTVDLYSRGDFVYRNNNTNFKKNSKHVKRMFTKADQNEILKFASPSVKTKDISERISKSNGKLASIGLDETEQSSCNMS